MAINRISDPITASDQSTNQVQYKKSKFLANRAANFWQNNSKLFPHTFFSDFTKEDCLTVGQCSVGGVA